MKLNHFIVSFGIFGVVVITLNSCNKDQAVVKEIAGDWMVTAQSTNGVSAPDSTFAGTIYHFEKCKVSKGDCDGTITVPDPTKGSFEMSFTYSISDGGETITFNITDPFFGLTTTDVASIDEHSKSKFVFSSTDSTSTTTTTLEPK